MTKDASILLLTDSSSALPGFGTENFPFVSVKPGEVVWNGMQTEDPIDPQDRILFQQHAEVIERSSGLVDEPRWQWGDSIADRSVDYDSVFVFAPHEDIFIQQMDEIVNAQVLQKTHYAPFVKSHGRQTGKLKSLVIKTHNWFAGIGLAVWQCHQLLNKVATSQSMPLSHVKKYFEQLSARTRTVSIMPCNQLHPWTRNQIIDESLMSKMRGNIGRTRWISVELGKREAQVSERESMEVQLETQLQKIITVILEGKLGFSRIVVSCSNAQLAVLKKTPAFLQLDKMQSAHKFKWLHQPAPITAQILTGKDAIHLSYSSK